MSAQDIFMKKQGNQGTTRWLATSCSSLAQCSSSAETTALSMSGDPNWFLLIPYVSSSRFKVLCDDLLDLLRDNRFFKHFRVSDGFFNLGIERDFSQIRQVY